MSVKTKAWIASCATSGSGVWTSDMGVLGVTLEARLSLDHRDNEEEAEELTEPDRARLTCQSWIAEAKRLPRSALPCFSSAESCTGRPLICTVGIVRLDSFFTVARETTGSRGCNAP